MCAIATSWLPWRISALSTVRTAVTEAGASAWRSWGVVAVVSIKGVAIGFKLWHDRNTNHSYLQSRHERPPLYVCNCNGITEREIRGAASLGCATLQDLRRELGVGGCCGKCVPQAGEILRQCTGNCAQAVRMVSARGSGD